MSLLNLDRRKAQLVAARDLRDAVSELRLIIAMVGLAVAIPVAAAIGVRGLALYGGGTAVVNRLSVVGAFFVVFIPASFSLVLALESFVGERERTTLEVLISTPLKEAEIYAGKVAAVLAISLGLCYGGLALYCIAVFPGLGYFPLDVLIALALSTVCQVAAMVAGAVIISLNARTMRAANVMASFIILPMSVALQAEAALILLGRTEFLWGFAGLMLALAAILLRMGLNGFSRELPAQAGHPAAAVVAPHRAACRSLRPPGRSGRGLCRGRHRRDPWPGRQAGAFHARRRGGRRLSARPAARDRQPEPARHPAGSAARSHHRRRERIPAHLLARVSSGF